MMTFEVKLTGDQLADVSQEILARAASLRFTATGSSMSPFIRDGDQVTIERVKAAELRLGDVALYRSFGGRALVHRFLWRRKAAGGPVCLIRGDASCGACEEVPAEQVLGRVVEVSRDGHVFHPGGLGRRIFALTWAYASPFTFRAWRLVRKVRRLGVR